MDALERRPFFCVALAWAAGIASATINGPNAFFAAVVLSVLAIVLIPLFKFRLLCAALLCAALGCVLGALAVLPAYSAAGYKTSGLYGTVISSEISDGRTTITLAGLNGSDGRTFTGKAAFIAYGKSWVEAGNRVYIRAPLKAVGTEQLSWLGKGVFYTGYGLNSDVTRIDRRVSLRGYMARVRDKCAEVLETCCGDAAPLVRGLVLGDRGDIPQFTREAFKIAGISHILAVSGLHVGFIALIISGAMSLLRLRGVPRFLVEAALLFAYAIITGGRPSVARAVLMYLIYRLGPILGRRSDSLTTLAAAFLAITAVSPLSVLDVGLELSFLSVLGIILLMPRFEGWLGKLPGFVKTSMAMTVSATSATLPVAVNTFGTVSLIGVLVNIVAVPLAGVLTVLGTLTLFAGLIFQPLGMLMGDVVKGLAYLLMTIAHISAQVPFAEAEIKAQSFMSAVYYSLALVSLSNYAALQRKERISAFTSLAALSALTWGIR